MTNKEKFIEVFGEELQRQYITKSWWEQEYVPPTLDVKPKTGRWIAIKDGFECSECGCISRSRADFCQYCEAKMK